MTSKWINRLRTIMLLWAFAACLGLVYVVVRYFSIDHTTFWQLRSPSPVPHLMFMCAATLFGVVIYSSVFSAFDLKRRLGFAGLFLFMTGLLTTMFGFASVFIPHNWFYYGAVISCMAFVTTNLAYIKVKRELRLMGIY